VSREGRAGLPDQIPAFQVVAGATLEVTTAQFWSTAGDSELEQEVEFHGVTADPASAFIDGSAGLQTNPCSTSRGQRNAADVDAARADGIPA
jgi:hypothetical protein